MALNKTAITAFFFAFFYIPLSQATPPSNPSSSFLEVSVSIVIDAPVEAVWKYASDSTRAKEWSVYFDHISPIPGEIPDGQVGSVRRCYRLKDENSGLRWDEQVTEITPLQHRHIHVFNLQGYKLESAKQAVYEVDQFYESLSPTSTRMTFRTTPGSKPSLAPAIAFLMISPATKRIFRVNLENIKAAVETGENYRRLHEWEEFPLWWEKWIAETT